MDNSHTNTECWQRDEKAHRRGKIMGGLLVLAAGSLFLARELEVDFPRWLLSWKTLIIGIGLVSGIKNNFRGPGWIIMILIGTSFLVADIYQGISIRPFLIPVILILIGLFMIFRPSRRRHTRWHHRRYGNRCAPGGDFQANTAGVDEDFIDHTSFMGGIKKNVICKNFRGGDITNVFGGSEINLMQADFKESANLEITQVFGGTRLIIPANWQIKSTLVTVLGGIEDKRPVQPPEGAGLGKVLNLSGTTFCGGIEISSY